MRIILFLVISVLITSTVFCQSLQLAVKNLDDDEDTILTTLFNANIVVNDEDSVDVAVWKPNFSEAQEFNVSFDSMCYTNIDQIMNYHSFDRDYGLIVFTTYHYIDSDFIKQDCHACAPDVSVAIFSQQTDSTWKFERMKKHLIRWGKWGHIDDVGIRKIGDSLCALDFDGGYGGQGAWETIRIFYELESFEEIFSCKTHEDNSGTGYESARLYDWDKTIKFIPAKNQSGYYDIVVTKKGKGHKVEDDYDSPIIKFKGKERYRFEENLNKYILIK